MNAKLVDKDTRCRDCVQSNPVACCAGPCWVNNPENPADRSMDSKPRTAPFTLLCDPEGVALSVWGPWAKGFGNVLDFNCSIILVPVLRTILRALYNISTSGETCSALMVRYLLMLVPVDKNLAFHKLIAKVIGTYHVLPHTSLSILRITHSGCHGDGVVWCGVYVYVYLWLL